MKDYNKNKESSYLKYWDANNLYGWAMSQKLLVNKSEYKDIAEDVETRFDTSNFEIDRELPTEKNEKSNCTNERLIRWTNHERICCIKSKNI